MKGKRNKICAGLLALSLLLSACAGSGSRETVPADAPAAAREDASSAAGEEDDPVELTVWAILSPEITDYETNNQSEWYEEYSGIRVHWINVPMHGWADSFQMSVMGGEYPDIYLYDFSTSEVDICAEYGAIIPLNDLIEENCPNIRQYLEENPKLKEMITAPDGNLYTLFSQSYNTQAYSQKLWVNRTWLDQYTADTGSGMPETLEEFETMLCYFRDHDMNGNGDASDEIPYMGCAGMEGIFTLLGGFLPANSSASAFGCVAGEDGQCQFYFYTPEFREGLAYLHRLYTQGLLSDQTFTISPQERCGYSSRGQQGSSVGVVSAMNISQIVELGSSEMDYTSYLAIPPLEGPRGVRTAVTSGESVVSLRNAITSACEHPEAAARWLDYWYSEEGRLWAVNGGLEGRHWFYREGESAAGDGKVVVHRDGLKLYDNFCWRGQGVAYMIQEQDYEHMDLAGLGENAELATYKANQAYSPYLVSSGWPDLVWASGELADYASEYSELEKLIEDHVTEWYTSFILGKRDIEDDAQWEEYTRGLEDLGLARYQELVNVYVSSGK